MVTEGRGSFAKSARSILAPAGLFVLALCVRILPWHSVFRPEGVLFYGSDAFYHLRRIQYSVSHFPDVLDFDPFINFPHGAQPIWPPTLDWLIAAVLRVLVGSDDPHGVELLAVFLPPIAGAATVAIFYYVARRFYSNAAALLAAGILAILPAHFFYSQLGFVDHHVFVALVATLMLGSMMELLRAGGDAPPAAHGAALRQSVLLGLAMAAAILLWPGALIHVGIVQAGMVARLLVEKRRTKAIAWARRFALANFVTLLGVLPLSAGNEWPRWGSYSAVVLSNFQPLYFGAAALCFSLVGLVWQRGWLCGDRRARSLAAAACGAALIALLLVTVQELRQTLFDAWAWLVKLEEFQTAVNESAPLFSSFTTIHGSRATALFSVFVYFVPFAIAGLAWRSRRRADRLFFLWWALALFAATAIQWRFMNSYVIAHSLLLALVVQAVRDRFAPRTPVGPVARWAAAGLAACLALYLLFPIWLTYRPHLVNAQRVMAGKAPVSIQFMRRQALVVAAARWLKENSPSPRDDPYSVLGPWGDGHILKYVAERPVVQDNFGDDVALENFELAEDYFSASDEGTALEILEKTGTRYVMVRSTGSGQGRGEYGEASLLFRLFKKRGSAARARGGAAIPALQHHRLIYESPRARGRADQREPRSRIYEIVEGARLVGRAAPGSIVRAQLSLRSHHGGGFHYSASTGADAEGRYELVLPYPNEPFSPSVEAGERYTIRSGNEYGHVSIAEEAVRSGSRVEGPSLHHTETSPDDTH
jgi:dolichyl-diphosphooligosaccharide--protein glycosyltransferase